MANRTYRDLYPTRELWNNPAWFDLCADLTEGSTDEEPEGCTASDNCYGLWSCTRPAAHTGPHVADDGKMVMHVWEDPSSIGVHRTQLH